MNTNEVINNVTNSILYKQASVRITDKDVKLMASLTDGNAHTEALIYLYENILKNKRAVKALKAIQELRNFFGHMPKGILDLEYNEFYKPAFKQAERVLNEEDFIKLQGAF